MSDIDTRSDQSSRDKKVKLETQQGELLSIPSELLLDILLRLTVEDVLRSRLVCNEWNILLRTPMFISHHYDYWSRMRHQNDPASSSFILLQSNDDDDDNVLTFLTLKKTSTAIVATVDREVRFRTIVSSVSFPPNVEPPTNYGAQFFCPVDGLVCFGCGEHVIMYNPATRESRLLPQCSDLELCFIRRFKHCVLNAWFDSIQKQYKVFRMVGLRRNCVIKIYDSSDNSWRASKTIFGKAHPLTCLLFNEILHFYMEKDSGHVIVTFDARLETFGHLELPCCGEYNAESVFLSFNGNLAFLKPNLEMHEEIIYCDIWVMLEYGVGKPWTKAYSIFDGVIHADLLYVYAFCPLAFWKSMDGNDELLVKSPSDGMIMSINLDTRKTTYSDLYYFPYRMNKIARSNVDSLLPLY